MPNSPDDFGSCARAFVGVGSNLGDRLGTLRELWEHGERSVASSLPGSELVRVSSIYESVALGPAGAPFLNAVMELVTFASPESLMGALHALERAHGRVRRERWAARTLDLDLLVYCPRPIGPVGTWCCLARTPSDAGGLVLPHPELIRRDFVLAPLAELVPELRPTGCQTVAELLSDLPAADRTILGVAAKPAYERFDRGVGAAPRGPVPTPNLRG